MIGQVIPHGDTAVLGTDRKNEIVPLSIHIGNPSQASHGKPVDPDLVSHERSDRCQPATIVDCKNVERPSIVETVPNGAYPLMPHKGKFNPSFLYESIPLNFKLQETSVIRYHIDKQRTGRRARELRLFHHGGDFRQHDRFHPDAQCDSPGGHPHTVPTTDCLLDSKNSDPIAYARKMPWLW